MAALLDLKIIIYWVPSDTNKSQIIETKKEYPSVQIDYIIRGLIVFGVDKKEFTQLLSE